MNGTPAYRGGPAVGATADRRGKDRGSMIRIAAATLAVLLLVVTGAPHAQAQALNPFTHSNFSLTQGDIDMIRTTTAPFYADDTIPLGTALAWSNGHSGDSGTATLVDRFTHNDMSCRRIQHDIRIKSVADPFRFIIDTCQVADGSWKML